MALSTNLVSYWKLDGNSNDAAGSNNGTDTSITYPTGLLGNAADLNATSDTIIVASSASLEMAAQSISFWIKTTDTSTNTNVLSRYEDATKRSIRMLFGNSAGKVSCAWYDTANNNTNFFPSATINNGAWHHVVFVCDTDGTNLRIAVYTDGSQTGSTATQPGSTTSIKITGGARWTFGGPNGIESSGFIGTLDEIGLWSRALTAAEVTSLYNSGAGKAYPFGTAYASTLNETLSLTTSLIKTASRLLSEVLVFIPNLSRGIVPNIASGPNSLATTTDDATVGTISWTNPGNVKVSDDTYATCSVGNNTP